MSVAEDCLSPERTFHGCSLMHGLKSGSCRFWRIKFSLERFSDLSHICLRIQPLESALGRVPQAADSACNKIFANWIVSVAEDCLSPERTFHGCPLLHFRGCVRGSILSRLERLTLGFTYSSRKSLGSKASFFYDNKCPRRSTDLINDYASQLSKCMH